MCRSTVFASLATAAHHLGKIHKSDVSSRALSLVLLLGLIEDINSSLAWHLIRHASSASDSSSPTRCHAILLSCHMTARWKVIFASGGAMLTWIRVLHLNLTSLGHSENKDVSIRVPLLYLPYRQSLSPFIPFPLLPMLFSAFHVHARDP